MTRLSASRLGQLLVLLAIALFTLQCETEATGSDVLDEVSLRTDAVETPNDPCNCLMNYPVEDLSAGEVAALTYMWEEEKLAGSVYQRMYEAWGAPVFANIAEAEQRHMRTVQCLMTKYGLENPAAANADDEFTNPELAALYPQLVETGLGSLEAAYRIGAMIEDLDIKDLQESAAAANNADLLAAFAELERGSRNHLRGFTRQLTALQVAYVPSYITSEEYETIISTPTERGSKLCPNTGNGNNETRGQCTRSDQGSGNAGNCTQSGNGPNAGNCPQSGNGPNAGNGPGNGTGTCTNPGNNGNNGNNGNGNGG
jgi:hypothetical protein